MGDLILVHSGVKGQKWGKRNYRNYDGTLTEEGKKRYDYYDNKTDRAYESARNKQITGSRKDWSVLNKELSKYNSSELKALNERAELERRYKEFYSEYKYRKAKEFIKEAASVATVISTLYKTLKFVKKTAKQGGGKP